MEIRDLGSAADMAAAARLALAAHERLRAAFPYLPPLSAGDIEPRIGRVARRGRVAGLFAEGGLRAFLGGLPIDDFRNAGPGAYCPDWCHGAEGPGGAGAAASGAGDSDRPSDARGANFPAFDVYRALYRDFAESWRARGRPLHAIGIYATEAAALEAFSLTGFGRIMVDAARPTAELRLSLAAGAVSARRAAPADAPALERLNADLASHIASSPILLPGARGRSAAEWEAWLREPGSVAFLAESDGVALGYIKAEAPQDDVSLAVHGDSTLAIDGMYVSPGRRRGGVGSALLAALASEAALLGRELLSVDCETTNPEAYGFWTRFFRPVSWGLERRT